METTRPLPTKTVHAVVSALEDRFDLFPLGRGIRLNHFHEGLAVPCSRTQISHAIESLVDDVVRHQDSDHETGDERPDNDDRGFGANLHIAVYSSSNSKAVSTDTAG